MNTDEELPKKKPVLPVTEAGAVATQKAKASSGFPVAEYFPKAAATWNDMHDSAQEAMQRGANAEAAGRRFRGMVKLPFALRSDVLDKTAVPVGQAIMNFAKGALDLKDAPATPPVSAPTTTDAPANKEAAPSSPAAPVADASVPTTQSAAREVAKGVYEHGRGQFSDNPDGLGLRFTGKPSAQNMRAADALAQRSQQASIARVRAAQQGPSATRVSAPSVAHSGNDWRAQMDLRNARAGASSVLSEARMRGWGPRRTAAMLQYDPRMLEYRALLERDNAARGVQPQAAMQAMAHNAQNQRQAMGLNVDVQRLGLAQQQHDLEAQKAAGTIESQAQLQQLQKQFMEEKDPQKKEGILEAINRLFGSQRASDRYMTIDGGFSEDSLTGAKTKKPNAIFDTQSGRFIEF